MFGLQILNSFSCTRTRIHGFDVIDSVLIVKLSEFQDNVNLLLCIVQFFLQPGNLFC